MRQYKLNVHNIDDKECDLISRNFPGLKKITVEWGIINIRSAQFLINMKKLSTIELSYDVKISNNALEEFMKTFHVEEDGGLIMKRKPKARTSREFIQGLWDYLGFKKD